MRTKVSLKCESCGKDLPEDADREHWTTHGQLLCDGCECEMYHFTCCLCGNCEDTEHQDEIGCLLVVTEECGIDPAVYEITKHPYYGGPVIGGTSVFPQSLKRIADLPKNVETDGYPCGHLCRSCAGKVRGLHPG